MLEDGRSTRNRISRIGPARGLKQRIEEPDERVFLVDVRSEEEDFAEWRIEGAETVTHLYFDRLDGMPPRPANHEESTTD